MCTHLHECICYLHLFAYIYQKAAYYSCIQHVHHFYRVHAFLQQIKYLTIISIGDILLFFKHIANSINYINLHFRQCPKLKY